MTQIRVKLTAPSPFRSQWMGEIVRPEWPLDFSESGGVSPISMPSARRRGIATGLRDQRALDQQWLFIIDAFAAIQEATDLGQGVRLELQSKL